MRNQNFFRWLRWLSSRRHSFRQTLARTSERGLEQAPGLQGSWNDERALPYTPRSLRTLSLAMLRRTKVVSWHPKGQLGS